MRSDPVGSGSCSRGERFCRYEFKYRLPSGLAAPVGAFVAAHLPHDAYSAMSPDRMYTIGSLYLDSTDLRLCRESLTGQKNRFKLRIRGYDDRAESPVFLEIKRRLNTVIMKDRCGVDRDDLTWLPAAGSPSNATPTARQFKLYRDSLAARPQVMVRYQREAFEGAGPSRVRVTLDRDLRCRLTHDWNVQIGGGGWRAVMPDAAVLEIKFSGRYPAWLQQLVRRFRLQAQSVSKYTLSMDRGLPAAHGVALMKAEA
jgi:hypothetical protein